MTIIDSVESLDAALTVLRKHGVTTAKLGPVEITLGAAPRAETPMTSSKQLDTETCRCGHPFYDHSPTAGCQHGCPLTACVPLGDEEV